MSLTAFQQEEARLRREADAINAAAKAFNALTLEGMTQHRWQALTQVERATLLDTSGLSPQLKGLKGWRVEVIDEEGDEPRRFIVGQSTGWRPCNIELHNIRANGGVSARMQYHRVTKVKRPDGKKP